MDITKFNTQLATKIAKAKSCEKNGDKESAINQWIEISEMTLNFSKSPELDFSFRNMLIKRTEQIFQHIKDLKSPKKKKEMIVAEPKVEEILVPKVEPSEKIIEKKSNSKNLKPTSKVTPSSPKNDEKKGISDDDWMDKVDFKSPSKGIVEISAPKDFKIITPHDPEYVEKMKKLSDETDISALKREEKPDDYITIKDEKTFCEHCGANLTPNAKDCKECGTKIN